MTDAEEIAFRERIPRGIAAIPDQQYEEDRIMYEEAIQQTDNKRSEIRNVLNEIRISEQRLIGTRDRRILLASLDIFNSWLTKDPQALQSLEYDLRTSVEDYGDERANYRNLFSILFHLLIEYDTLKLREAHLYSRYYSESKRRFHFGLFPWQKHLFPVQ
jgi:hypothetical protein